jgi:hypothetical protein
MNPEDETPLESSGDVAASIFGDISNPAVESAVEPPEGTGSVIEPVVEEAPVVEVPPVVPATPVVPVVPAAAPVAPAPAAPAPPTAEQIAQFQAWQAQQAQQFVPVQQPVQQQPVHQPQAPRQLTEPEIDKAINRYRVTPEEFNALFNEPDPAKAVGILDGMLQKAVVQAVTMAKHLIDDSASQVQRTVQPYMQFADAQREVMLQEQFFQANPDLKGQDLLIGNVMAQMAVERQKGVYQPQSEAQVFSDVATRTKALIAAMQQQGHVVLPAQPGAVQTPVAPAGKPRMAVLPTRGGGGGAPPSAAGNAAAAGESQDARSIFG